MNKRYRWILRWLSLDSVSRVSLFWCLQMRCLCRGLLHKSLCSSQFEHIWLFTNTISLFKTNISLFLSSVMLFSWKPWNTSHKPLDILQWMGFGGSASLCRACWFIVCTNCWGVKKTDIILMAVLLLIIGTLIRETADMDWSRLVQKWGGVLQEDAGSVDITIARAMMEDVTTLWNMHTVYKWRGTSSNCVMQKTK